MLEADIDLSSSFSSEDLTEDEKNESNSLLAKFAFKVNLMKSQ
jgi:hypothetical protein